MSEATVTLLVLAVCVGLFISNRVPVGVVAILTSLSLLALGVVDLHTALGGFGDPVVVFIASLFVVAEGLDASGLTAWVGRRITSGVRSDRISLLVVLMLVTAVLSALVTPNGAAAAMIPVVLATARSTGVRPAALLMPVAFAASAGALLTLSGSVVNVMVSEAAAESVGREFGFFEFAGAGVFLVAGSVLVAALFGRMVPEERGASIQRDFGAHLDTLIDHYDIDQGFFRLRVAREPVEALTARGLRGHGAVVYAVQGRDGQVMDLDDQLHEGDTVLATGPGEAVRGLTGTAPLEVDQVPLTRASRERMLHEHVGLAEVIVPPRSMLIGESFFTGMRRGVITVLALRRGSRDVGTSHVRLAEGDTLLLHGPWPAIHQLEDNDDVLLVDSPAQVQRQLAPLGASARWAGAITVGMVVLLASGLVAPAAAGLLAACAMVLTRVVTVPQAYSSVSWQTVVLIGGLIPLSVAIRDSGAADLIAGLVVSLSGSGNVFAVLSVVFVVTALLGQVISNAATALVMIPIAVAISQVAGLDTRMVLMSLAVASGASLLTPIATPANMMVSAAAGYRFGDYWRFGAVTMVVWFLVGVLLVPAVWSP